ncbi:glycosyltransferase [Kibdelosporangium lantanae]|uniref:Glycosyltransferase n=1 Tax=Kibdelosporangium lantanae TaxID=1497396 RepID=A0ABW3MFM2_9PSEU
MSAWEDEDGRLSSVFRDALRRAGLRGVIQSGVAGLDGGHDDDDVVTIGNVSYDWLMPRVSAVVHRASAGTLAATLRAGLPCSSVPVAFDNLFWARRLVRLGVSSGFSSVRDVGVERLAYLMGRAAHDSGMRARAAGLASKLAADDGAGRILAELEENTHRRAGVARR